MVAVVLRMQEFIAHSSLPGLWSPTATISGPPGRILCISPTLSFSQGTPPGSPGCGHHLSSSCWKRGWPRGSVCEDWLLWSSTVPAKDAWLLTMVNHRSPRSLTDIWVYLSGWDIHKGWHVSSWLTVTFPEKFSNSLATIMPCSIKRGE